MSERSELDRDAMALICDATACTSNTAMRLWDKLQKRAMLDKQPSCVQSETERTQKAWDENMRQKMEHAKQHDEQTAARHTPRTWARPAISSASLHTWAKAWDDMQAYANELERENAELRYDIERYVVIDSELATEIAELRAQLAKLGPKPCCFEWETCKTPCVPRASNWMMAAKDAERQRDEARKDAAEGWEAAVDWAGYASEYFQEKHGLADDVKRLEAARAKLKESK